MTAAGAPDVGVSLPSQEHLRRAQDAHRRYERAYFDAHGREAERTDLIEWLQTPEGRDALGEAYCDAGLIA